MGIPLKNEMLYTLCFADDQVVKTQNYEDICYMTRKREKNGNEQKNIRREDWK